MTGKCFIIRLEKIEDYHRTEYLWRESGLRYLGLPEDAYDSFFLFNGQIPGYPDGVTGEYAAPSVYLPDQKAAEEYDLVFHPKEKLNLSGQIIDHD